MKRPSLLRGAAAALASLTLAGGAAHAAEFGNITINGYGNQSFIRTTDNAWLGADSSGSFKDNVFALVVTAKLDERSKIWSQLASISGSSIDVHWFYVDRTFGDQLTLRAGKVLAPLGFYNEYIDARFLQQSTILPLLYQPDTDLVDEAYGGLGGTWSTSLGGGKVDVDLYGGQIVEHAAVAALQKQKGLIGARIDWRTPIDGLRLMLSASTKKQLTIGDPDDTTKTSMIVSAGYDVGPLELKAEFGHIKNSMGGTDSTTSVGYLQAGYSLTDNWIPFARYDMLRAPGYDSADASTYQNTLALGITYRVNANLAFRLENHFNTGYGAAALSGETAAGQGQKTWQMLAASVAFIF
ncbi:MAG: hypothetical protein EHM87_12205 [Burkholderiales bacterium]|nr:MAG: hypothetical protein EHM87_12205 [Burkholderiales bacterium]